MDYGGSGGDPNNIGTLAVMNVVAAIWVFLLPRRILLVEGACGPLLTFTRLFKARSCAMTPTQSCFDLATCMSSCSLSVWSIHACSATCHSQRPPALQSHRPHSWKKESTTTRHQDLHRGICTNFGIFIPDLQQYAQSVADLEAQIQL